MVRSLSAWRVAPLVVGVVLAQALLVALFAWPAASAAPHHLPLVVAGPAPAAGQAAAALRSERPGAFDVRTVTDATAADRALRHREAYGAVLLGPTGPSMHLASAASPAVAALLTSAAPALGRGAAVPVTDVVPTDPDDPRGGGLVAGLLPFVLTSLIAGALLGLWVRRPGTRLAAVIGYAALAGLGAAFVLRYWLGVLPGSYLGIAWVAALLALAASATVAGLATVFGEAGVALGALAVFVLANPISGLSTAPELVPTPWGTIGQYLPVGAGGTLLRSVVYFDGHGGTRAWVVLGCWALAGLLLLLARGGRPTPRTALGGRPPVPSAAEHHATA